MPRSADDVGRGCQVIRNNCNHFTDELCAALCNKSIPEWINRPAKMGASTLEALALPFKVRNPKPCHAAALAATMLTGRAMPLRSLQQCLLRSWGPQAVNSFVSLFQHKPNKVRCPRSPQRGFEATQM